MGKMHDDFLNAMRYKYNDVPIMDPKRDLPDIMVEIKDYDDRYVLYKNDHRVRTEVSMRFGFCFVIKKVIFNPPATIVYWKDGTKTVVKCNEDDIFDKEIGLAMCFMKKACDNKSHFNDILKKYCHDDEDENNFKIGDFVSVLGGPVEGFKGEIKNIKHLPGGLNLCLVSDRNPIINEDGLNSIDSLWISEKRLKKVKGEK